MSTAKEFHNYVLEQLAPLGDVRSRAMMGEYLLYYHDILFGGIYDNKLLLKETPNLKSLNLPQIIPYSGAKRTMYYLENLDDTEKLQEIIRSSYSDLSKRKTS